MDLGEAPWWMLEVESGRVAVRIQVSRLTVYLLSSGFRATSLRDLASITLPYVVSLSRIGVYASKM